MTIYLDEQLEDEPLFGIVARYIETSPGVLGSRVIKSLYGKGVVASLLGSHYGHVAKETQSCWGLTSQEIIHRMTLFPYVSRFWDREAADKLLSQIIRDGPLESSKRAAWRPWGGKELRYCRRCFAEDRERGSPLHWRRTHQLPAVVTCVYHDEFLWRQKIKQNKENLGFVSPDFAFDLDATPVVSESMDVRRGAALQYAKISYDLLNGNLIINRDDVCDKFFGKIKRKINVRGDTNCVASVGVLIENCFGSDYMGCVGFKASKISFLKNKATFSYSRNASWFVLIASLVEIIERDSSLLNRHYFNSVLDKVSSSGDTGKSPWFRERPTVECPNVIASHGAGHVVERTEWRDSTLKCACSCGMRFRCAELSVGIGPPQITRWGESYILEVGRLFDAGIAPPSISETLGVPFRTVWNMLNALGKASSR